MCLYPRLIQNPKYKSTAKNRGVIPPIKDTRVTKVPIGCGQCIECVNQKGNKWRTRLIEDIKHNINGKFITLTFSNESIAKLIKEIPKELQGYDIDNAIATLATRRFLENIRSKHGKSVRHWLITEIGHKGTENIHLHGIIWTNLDLNEIEKKWIYGFMWKGKMKNEKIVNYVNEATINYITKYVTKKDFEHPNYKAIILTSAGIGKDYINQTDAKKNKFDGTNTKETYRTRNGNKVTLPIYWRNKIYTEEQREQLWLQKLDKQERWVLGVKIDVSKGEEEYWQALKSAQETNKELGYGKSKDERKDWEQVEYEKQLRNMKIKQRIENSAFGEK